MKYESKFAVELYNQLGDMCIENVRVFIPKIGECKVLEIRHVSDPRYCEGIVGKIQDESGKIRSIRFTSRNKIHFLPFVDNEIGDLFCPPIVSEIYTKWLRRFPA